MYINEEINGYDEWGKPIKYSINNHPYLCLYISPFEIEFCTACIE